MNSDLEMQLAEMGGEFAGLKAALARTGSAHVSSGFASRVVAEVARVERRRRWLLRAGWWTSAAAALVVLLALHGVGVAPARPATSGLDRLVASQRSDGTFSASSASSYVQAYAVQALASARDSRFTAQLEAAVQALVRSQSGEGGWGDARRSSYNVAALAAAEAVGVASAKVPFKRGLRYLRANGIPERPAGELEKAARAAVDRMAAGVDLANSIAQEV